MICHGKETKDDRVLKEYTTKKKNITRGRQRLKEEIEYATF